RYVLTRPQDSGVAYYSALAVEGCATLASLVGFYGVVLTWKRLCPEHEVSSAAIMGAIMPAMCVGSLMANARARGYFIPLAAAAIIPSAARLALIVIVAPRSAAELASIYVISEYGKLPPLLAANMVSPKAPIKWRQVVRHSAWGWLGSVAEIPVNYLD